MALKTLSNHLEECIARYETDVISTSIDLSANEL